MNLRAQGVLFVLLIIFAVPVCADEDCDKSLAEAKQAYNKGNYTKAKELFVYVQDECGTTYGSADSWVKKCNSAIQEAANPTTLSLSKSSVSFVANGGSTAVTVSSNKSWSIDSYPESWCQITKSGATISIAAAANTSTASRSTSLRVKTSDGKKSASVNIYQGPKEQVQTSTEPLSLDKTSIYASSSGTTEYITVSGNQEWEIKYPSATMYSAAKSGNYVKVVINSNSGAARNDYFYVKTTDGSQEIKVSLSQGGTGSSSSSSSSSSSYSSSSSRKSYSRSYHSVRKYYELDDYNDMNGKWEVDWLSTRMGLCTGYGFELSTMGVRFSCVKLEPIIFGLRYDFVEDYFSLYYQPDVKLILPWDDEWAAVMAIGPSINMAEVGRSYYKSVWFTLQLGVLWHWGTSLASEFFMRYDGMFTLGVSFDICTGF